MLKQVSDALYAVWACITLWVGQTLEMGFGAVNFAFASEYLIYLVAIVLALLILFS